MSQLNLLIELADYDAWAMRRILDSTTKLSDAQLDQKFEMGMGTLRMTMKHIVDADEICSSASSAAQKRGCGRKMTHLRLMRCASDGIQ